MEEFQAQWILEADKFQGGLRVPTLPFHSGFDRTIEKSFHGFESPMMNHDRRPRRDSVAFETSNLDQLTKDDDFMLDSANGIKHEHEEPVNQSFQNQGAPSHLDIQMDSNYLSKPQDYTLDCYQISRSRGPSFNFTRERRGSEDFFSSNMDFMRYFRNVRFPSNY